VGHHYVQDAVTFEMTSDLNHFVATLHEAPLPSRDLLAKLDVDGISALRSNNGCLSYATSGRPESCGKCAISQQNIATATVRDLKFSNMCIRELKREDSPGTLYYPQLGSQLKVCVVVDSSHRSNSSLHPQGAYMILLCERNAARDVGGRCHVLEFSTKKSTRIARSSFAAETLAANRGSEVGVKLAGWLREVEEGAEDVRTHMLLPSLLPVQLVTDAHDLWATLQCDKPYRGADQSCTLYVEALKEDLAHARLHEICWIPTKSMLVDSMTKHMPDVLITQLMRTGVWTPTESKVWSIGDTYFVDMTEQCVKNFCACLWYSSDAFSYVHLPVVAPEEPLGPEVQSEIDLFEKCCWLCDVTGNDDEHVVEAASHYVP
jgi:hypothetical protein